MRPKLSDIQLVILSTACQRDDRLVLPLPDRIKGGAAAKVVGSLLAKGLVEEVPAAPDQPVWREDDDRRLTLVATDAAVAALGVAPEDAPQGALRGGDDAPSAPGSESGAGSAASTDATPADDAPVAPAAPPTRKTRAGSKQARLVEMLKRPEGATIAEAAEALAWQSHTVRGAMAGALKKKLGLTIQSEKVENRGRVYRVA